MTGSNSSTRRGPTLSLVVPRIEVDGIAAEHAVASEANSNFGVDSIAPQKRPRVLVVTYARERFIDLRHCDIEWAQDELAATAAAISTHYDAIVCDVVIGLEAAESGYSLVRSLRSEQRVPYPIYLIADQPLPSDVANAVRCGATDLVVRDMRRVSRLLQGLVQTWSAPVQVAREPGWLTHLITMAQSVIASEAEPRTRAIYTTLLQRNRRVESSDVLSELARFIENPREREMFLRLAMGRT